MKAGCQWGLRLRGAEISKGEVAALMQAYPNRILGAASALAALTLPMRIGPICDGI
jgi:hypothetical protein